MPTPNSGYNDIQHIRLGPLPRKQECYFVSTNTSVRRPQSMPSTLLKDVTKDLHPLWLNYLADKFLTNAEKEFRFCLPKTTIIPSTVKFKNRVKHVTVLVMHRKTYSTVMKRLQEFTTNCVKCRNHGKLVTAFTLLSINIIRRKT